jgi:hypothetical protein
MRAVDIAVGVAVAGAIAACRIDAPSAAATPLAQPAPPPAASRRDRHEPAAEPDAGRLACTDVDERSGRAEDLDGDGTPDLLVQGYRIVTLYVRRDGCLRFLARIEAHGPVAFVDVVPRREPGPSDLVVDTWLFHGDSRRTTYRFIGDAYVEIGRSEEIPGLRMPRR